MSKFFGKSVLKESIFGESAFSESISDLFAKFFSDFGIALSDYDICGLGDGAQNAIKHTLDSTNRINRLILLSPTFIEADLARFYKDSLLKLQDRGIEIIVFLCDKDRDSSKEFFRDFGIIYFIKDTSHLPKDMK